MIQAHQVAKKVANGSGNNVIFLHLICLLIVKCTYYIKMKIWKKLYSHFQNPVGQSTGNKLFFLNQGCRKDSASLLKAQGI